MIAALNMPSWTWLLCFLFGLSASFLFNRFLKQLGKSVRLKIPIQRFEYLVLLVSFLILLWNTSFLLRITAITVGSPDVNGGDITLLIGWSLATLILAYVVSGFAVGEIIFVFIQGINGRRTNGKPEETEISISTRRLKSVFKEIAGYRKAKTDLDDFFEELTDTKEGNEKPEQ